MEKDTISALLGRSLTSSEDANFDLYLKISRESLDDLLCMRLCDDANVRYFDGREGYSTVFTDIFTNINEVTVNGSIVDADTYSARQWDRRNGKWFNSIVFDSKLCDSDEVVVDADWGFDTMPSDLQLLLARLFDLVTKQNNLDREVNSKKIEDFTISYNHSSITMPESLMESFVSDNNATISKYSMCTIGNIQHGRVC